MESKNIKSISLAGSTESNSSKKDKMPSTVNQDESNDQNPWFGEAEESTKSDALDKDLSLSKDTKTIIVKKAEEENN